MYHTCHYTLTWRATFLCHCLDPWLSITLPPFFQPSCCLNTFLRCYGYSRVNMKAQCMVQPMYTHAIPTKTESFSLHNYVVSTQLLIYICEIDLFQLILWYVAKYWFHLHIRDWVSQLQLTVVHLLPLGMDLWRAILTQQRVQWCSTAVTLVLFLRKG